LTGERDEDVPTFDQDGQFTSTTTRRVPVLSAAQIAQLPARHVVIIRRGMPPAVGTVQMAWRRRDVHAAARALRRAQRAARWAATANAIRVWIGAQAEELLVRHADLAERLGITLPNRPAPLTSSDEDGADV
jgi:type IV secretion system protein VirD4